MKQYSSVTLQASKERPRDNRKVLGLPAAFLLGFGYLAAAGCGGDSEKGGSGVKHGNQPGQTTDPSLNPSITGGSSSIDPRPGLDPDASIGSGGSNGSASPGGCAAETQKAELVPVDMYIMLDKSGSMWQMTGALTKWEAVKEALVGFFNDPESAGLGVGMQYFPLSSEGPLLCKEDTDCAPQFQGCKYTCALEDNRECTTDADCQPRESYGPCLGRCSTAAVACTVPPYATDAVAIGTLPGNAQALTDSINAQIPAHSTPSLYALSGAHDRARAWAAEHPDHRVAVVFATDGTPSQCDAPSHNFTTISDVAREAYEATPSVQTFVIGVFSTNGAIGAKPNLDLVAEAGGTESSFIVDQTQDVKQQFLAALAKIRGGQLSCDLKLPAPPSGQTLDFDRVNVTLKSGADTQFLSYVTSVEACGDEGGWYYDKNPDANLGSPTKIVLCANTCETVKGLTQGELGITLECETVVR